MRRLILEVPEKELSLLGINVPAFQKIHAFELLHFLRQDQTEFAAIWKVEFKNPSTPISELLVSNFLIEAQVLEQEKNGIYTIFIRGGPILSSVLNAIGVVDGYLFPPLEIRDGKIKISFLGSEGQVSSFLEKINHKGIHYRIILLSNVNFAPNSPLSKLTEKQREILTAAHKYGYYNIPRRINSRQLAKKIGIGDSTLVEHLRKAELRLLNDILNEQTN
jgi:hypothetical protein